MVGIAGLVDLHLQKARAVNESFHTALVGCEQAFSFLAKNKRLEKLGVEIARQFIWVEWVHDELLDYIGMEANEMVERIRKGGK